MMSLPELPYTHRIYIYIWFWPTLVISWELKRLQQQRERDGSPHEDKVVAKTCAAGHPPHSAEWLQQQQQHQQQEETTYPKKMQEKCLAPACCLLSTTPQCSVRCNWTQWDMPEFVCCSTYTHTVLGTLQFNTVGHARICMLLNIHTQCSVCCNSTQWAMLDFVCCSTYKHTQCSVRCNATQWDMPKVVICMRTCSNESRVGPNRIYMHRTWPCI